MSNEPHIYSFTDYADVETGPIPRVGDVYPDGSRIVAVTWPEHTASDFAPTHPTVHVLLVGHVEQIDLQVMIDEEP